MKLYEGNYKITSLFGDRILDNGDDRIHKGMDFVGIDSKNILTPTSGIIVSSQIITDKSNPTWEWGNYIKMDDLNGYFLFFCHLSKRLVNVGQNVVKGQIIGVEGQTGYAFGSHLHFEVRRKSDNVSIDPQEYFLILDDWEKKYLEKLKNTVKTKAGLDDNTIKFLSKHPYAYALFEKLAKAMK
jgi:murein DD-endopeptidase MepM/ murein hydrolase activator NlpD